jgi:hypothetical protein
MGGAGDMYRGEENAQFFGKNWRKGPVGEPRHKWKYNVRIDLEEELWEAVDCISPAQDSYQWWATVNTSYIKSVEFFD